MHTYDELSELVAKGFDLDEITESIAAAYSLAGSPSISHPSVGFLLASVLSSVKSRWVDGAGITVESAQALENRLIPRIRSLLDAVRRPTRPDEVLARLDDLIRAYGRCRIDIPSD
jgi:hypothetical protein